MQKIILIILRVQCRNPGCFCDNSVAISPPLSCKPMSADAGVASSIRLQNCWTSWGLILYITEHHRDQQHFSWGLVKKTVWPRQQKQLQIKVQIAFARKSNQDDCELTQGMGRKSSAHRDQLGRISLVQREIKLPICALTISFGTARDFVSVCAQSWACPALPGPQHPCSQSLSWLFDPKIGIGSAGRFWPCRDPSPLPKGDLKCFPCWRWIPWWSRAVRLIWADKSGHRMVTPSQGTWVSETTRQETSDLGVDKET